MIKVVSDQELNSILLDLCLSPHLYYIESHLYFSDLYRTGCRSTELLNTELWQINTNYAYLTTLKTHEQRRFSLSELSTGFKDAIKYNSRPYGGLTYDQLTLELRRAIKLHPIYSGKRIADTYLFRYNKARRLMHQYKSISQVMEIMAWKSEEVANSYINTPLIYNPHVN